MGHKSDADKAYDAGYRDGKRGGFMDDLVQGNKDLVPLPKGKHEGSYDGGYTDGHKDRYDSNDSHYQGGNSGGGGGSSDSGCFITTATLQSLGKDDQCQELDTFRGYRDHWLKNTEGGQKLIIQYYKHAPAIVAGINKQPNARHIYRTLWNNELQPCLEMIQQGKFEEVKSRYENVVKKLEEAYLK